MDDHDTFENNQDTLENTIRRLLIVDDHALVSETLQFAIGDSWDLAVQNVSSVQAALDLIKSDGTFDIILLDYQLPGISGFEGLRLLLDANIGRVALFSGVAPPQIVERAIEMGASGFVPKSIHLPALRHALNLMIFGEVYVPASLKLGAGQQTTAGHNFRQRELGVLRLVCEGRPNKEIAAELNIPATSVAVDVKSICRKLGAKNRTQIVIEAQRLGLL
jgi:two-component system, NarL family, nitrate/nitrite response regulator NarL